jgi:cellulose 1,4-beta-cellobiosidase
MKVAHWLAVGALSLAAIGASTSPAAAAPGCSVTYQASPWTESPGVGGFTANLTVTNTGDPVSGWTLVVTLPAGQSFTQGWSANWSASGTTLTATNLDWNANLGTGGSTSIGFNGRWTGAFATATTFTLNGTTCNGGGGNQPPTVSLTSPTPNQSFAAGAAVPLAANASDPGGAVARVEFLVDGNVVATDTTSPYTASATGLTAGTHTAAARAVDNGNPALSTTTGNVSFMVQGGGGGNQAPVVGLTSPTTGQSFAAGAAVPLAANASDPDGTVVRVEFLVDGTVVGIDATSPYTASATGLTGGSHTATARAVDNGNPALTTTSAGVAFMVQGGGGSNGKVDNPFAGATGYVNALWQSQVNQYADQTGGTLGAQMRVVGQSATAVWMDRIAAIDPPDNAPGLVEHLDAALFEDGNNGAAPIAIQIVIYDLPNRDCAALASNGELLIAQDGLARYETEYIDPIRSILARPAYANLRIVLIIEPDSLPNLVTNVSGAQASPRCQEAQQSGAYRDGVRYAVSQLSSLSNTYLYLDIAHSGWLGWPNNFDGALNVFDQVLATGQGGPGYDKIHGFITNTANYTPLDEAFLPNPNLQVGNGQLLSSTFYEFNPRFDERDYATNLQAAFAARGCTGCGMLIDTSRNGWGGAARPTAVSTSTDLNTYVNQSRIDRRPHRGGWCNQSGAGLGVRPTADTGIPGIDAFVWVKPPGESDGVSQAGIVDPDDPAKGFDAMCDPNAQNRYNTAFPTNALPGAPHAGRWFPAQFTMLVQNAFPAVPTG